jgi:signal transduction histidine kinase
MRSGLLRRFGPDALYARLGPAYVERYYRLLYASVFVFSIPAVFVALTFTTNGSPGTYVAVFTGGSASAIAALWLCVRWSRAHLEPATSWHPDDDADAAVAAWRATITAVPESLARSFATCLLVSGLPWTIAIAWLFSFSAYQTILCFVCVVIFALYPVVVHAFGFELYLGPLKRDIASRLPRDYSIEKPFPSLQGWLVGSLPIVTVVNGVFVAFYSSAVDNLTSKIVLSFAVTMTWTVTALFLIVRMVLRPVDELTNVAGRIRAGDLSARARPEREDELGMLLLEFNRMSDDLARARERLVTAREEERRRLRRDLHDGLGAVIAGVNVQLQAAVHALDRDPSRVGPLITGANAAVQNALEDVRRLVYGLRPPVLDALGLQGALRDHAGMLRGPGAPEFAVESDGDLGDLPAAVEVAALRIAQEAMTNVVRHAQASHCLVELSCNGALTVCVRDDGVGFGIGEQHSGVGLVSMRERASELGGTVAISASLAGGTEVIAVLPASSGRLG